MSTDEEIIKKRLIIDGDGTGDDRRINMLLKQFLKWTSTSRNESPENSQMLYDRIMAQLAQCQFAAVKSDLTYKMLDEEIKNYGNLSKEIEKNIELAKQEIEDCKNELTLAKEIRKNKMEYDLLAKIIKQEPDREETSKQIELLKKELQELYEKSAKLDRKLDKRRKDLELLYYAVRELEAQAAESSDDEDLKLDIEGTLAQLNAAKGSDDDSPSTSTSRKRKADTTDKESKKSTPDDDVKEIMSVDEELLELSLDKDDEEEKSLAS